MGFQLETQEIAPGTKIGAVYSQSVSVRTTGPVVYGHCEKGPLAILIMTNGQVSVFQVGGALLETKEQDAALGELIEDFRSACEAPL